MDAPDIKDEVLRLIHEVPRLGTDELMLRPASGTDVQEFESRFNLVVPRELREWLLICNGAPINPGGLFSLEEIARQYEWHPSWTGKGWIPLAGDGCGDSWVLATQERIRSIETHPIYFVDQSDYLHPAYVVASGAWHFFRFLFKDAILAKDFAVKPEHYADELLYDIHDLKREHYWPFDKEKVLEEDPGLAHYAGSVPFPWDTE